MAFFQCNFFSKAININTSMNVILPEETGGCEFPTLYLLHGYMGNYTDWMRQTAIERYVRDYRLAVIMPDAQKSFYNDFYGIKSGYKYWTFITEELIEMTRSFFKLSHRREDTYVAGQSMGGFGAFKCALNRPDLFAAAGSLSGALDVDAVLNNGEISNEVRLLLGEADDFKGSANDLFTAAERTAKLPVKPRLYQYCGTEDFFYNGNIRFRDLVKNLGYEYTYEESPGGHEWEYWDKYIKVFIEMLGLEKINL